MQQPKSITKNFKARNIKIGKDRRIMGTSIPFDKTPHFPKAVGYSDIDQAVFDWLNEDVEINYQGIKLPTYKLFSTQRLAEYAQNWQNIDEKGNLNLNFKTITRENNPQHGENQGNNYNIPGDRDYVIFKTYEVEEKGDEVVQIYTMKQPFSVNLVYTANIVTSSYNLLNEMNTKMQSEFKSLEKYIFPNGYAMPMELNAVSDESDYTIDDRKYYSQAYQFKVMAFIIKEEDFKVTKMRSRLRNQFQVGENRKNKVEKEKFNIGTFIDNTNIVKADTINDGRCKEITPVEIKVEENPNIKELIYTEPTVSVDELEGLQCCFEGTEYEINVNKKVIYNLSFFAIKNHIEFEIEDKLELETLDLTNIKSYRIKLNDVEVKIEDSDISFDKGDKLSVEVILKNPKIEGIMKIIAYDPDSEEASEEKKY